MHGDEMTRIAAAAAVRPHPRQLAWQRLELYGFAHFGMNTMTDREWGLGDEDPALFDPLRFDADQWVAAFASAGLRGLILTAKHHDGFCLWPSAVSTHTVAASPWRGGNGDVVAEVAQACERGGLAFGVYLSPWDRAAPTYGTGTAYDDHFTAQLTELLTSYGPIFSVWLDGANGEESADRLQRFDWDRYIRVVRDLQPNAVVSVCGPDVRWCGNEAGHTRDNEWSVVPASLRDAESVASHSQQKDDPAFARRVRSDEDDLGSREAILATDAPLVWYPAEVNTSIRPGWFHHPAEDGTVRSPDELFKIWQRSVGGNSTLLLNVPPTRDGLVHDADLATLTGFGERVATFLSRDIGPGPWQEDQEIEAVVLEEDIAFGQQIDELVVEAATKNRAFTEIARVHSIGYRRIVTFPAQPVAALRVRVLQHRGPVRLRPIRAIATT